MAAKGAKTMATPTQARQADTRDRPRHTTLLEALAQGRHTILTPAVKARRRTTTSMAAAARPWPLEEPVACLITAHTLHSHNRTTSRTRHRLLVDHHTDSPRTEATLRAVATQISSRTEDSRHRDLIRRRTKAGITGRIKAVLVVNLLMVASLRMAEVRPGGMEDIEHHRRRVCVVQRVLRTSLEWKKMRAVVEIYARNLGCEDELLLRAPARCGYACVGLLVSFFHIVLVQMRP